MSKNIINTGLVHSKILAKMSEAVLLIKVKDGSIVYSNSATERMFRYASDELIGLSFEKLHKLSMNPLKKTFANISISLTRKGEWHGKLQYYKKDGSHFWNSVNISSFIHPDHEEVWLVVLHDITKEKNVEDALVESEGRFRKINARIPGILYQFRIDPNGNKSLPYVGPTVQTIIGLSAEEVIGDVDKWVALTHPDDLPGLESSIALSMETMTTWVWEGRFFKNNSETVWLRGSSTPVRHQDGSIIWDGIFVDITQSKKTQQELSKFKDILDKTLDCVFMFNADNLQFFYVNEGALQQTGYSHNELLEMHPYDIKPDHTEKSFREFIAPLLSGDESTLLFETHHQHKDGRQITVEINLQLISYGEDFGSFVAIVRDITERTLTDMELENYRGVLETLVDERTEELSSARDEAQKSNIHKSEFLSRMSHELRTPLNAILGFSQLLELDAENFNKNQQENVQEIIGAGHHLLNLVNDVLDLSKIEAGKTDVCIASVKIDDLLKPCIALLRPLAEERNITIIDNVSGLGFSVMADFIRLKQVLINLLSNAVKYNRKSGSVTLSSEVVNNNYFRLSVTDTGNGLTEGEIAKLFSPFERLNNASNIEGAGIGLVITMHLIELMGGCMGVESNPGKGSTFWVEFSLSDDAGNLK